MGSPPQVFPGSSRSVAGTDNVLTDARRMSTTSRELPLWTSVSVSSLFASILPRCPVGSSGGGGHDDDDAHDVMMMMMMVVVMMMIVVVVMMMMMMMVVMVVVVNCDEE